MQALGEIVPALGSEVARLVRVSCAFAEPLPELVVGQLGTADAEHVEVWVRTADTGQIVERRDQFAMREIASRTEDDQQARVSLG